MEHISVGLFLLQIAGAAALLIWAVRLVRTGVERAWSVQLRRWLRRSADNRLMAAGSGAAAALMLQGSTAVALLTAAFAAAGTVLPAVGLAILLGADVGSAVVAQVLTLKLPWLVPLLLVAGVALFQRGERRAVRQAGRILIGLALIFVALSMIRGATEPLRDLQALVAAMHYLGSDPVTAFAIGALFAWAVHSSVAAVLLYVTLVAEQILPVSAAAAMVLGANLGGSMIAVLLTLKADIAARRIVTANLALRGGSALVVLAVLALADPGLGLLGAVPGRQVLNLHLAFNVGVALIALPFTGPATRAIAHLMPDRPDSSAALALPSALDPAALAQPDRALACAAREMLRMGEAIEAMLRPVMGLYDRWDDAVATALATREDAVDRMHFETKLFLARVQSGALTEDQARKAMEYANIANNLEAAGDAISDTITGLARRMRDDGLAFSDEGRRELGDFHDRVLANVQLALNVLMSPDHDAARDLVAEKDRVRDSEQALQRSHLARLRQGRAETVATSNIHQETLRALKQVNTAFTMVAYPLLAESGDLLHSRLAGGGQS